MSRNVPSDVAANLERDSSPDALIWFLTIDHSNLLDPIRVVSDVYDYQYGGNLYQGVLFDAVPVTDTDDAPSTRLRMQNVDRRIGEALQATRERAEVTAVALSSGDFDLTQDPRQPVGTPSTIYAFRHFYLVDVDVNVAEVTGRLMMADYSQEPWPATRGTADICPGLFA